MCMYVCTIGYVMSHTSELPWGSQKVQYVFSGFRQGSDNNFLSNAFGQGRPPTLGKWYIPLCFRFLLCFRKFFRRCVSKFHLFLTNLIFIRQNFWWISDDLFSQWLKILNFEFPHFAVAQNFEFWIPHFAVSVYFHLISGNLSFPPYFFKCPPIS